MPVVLGRQVRFRWKPQNRKERFSHRTAFPPKPQPHSFSPFIDWPVERERVKGGGSERVFQMSLCSSRSTSMEMDRGRHAAVAGDVRRVRNKAGTVFDNKPTNAGNIIPPNENTDCSFSFWAWGALWTTSLPSVHLNRPAYWKSKHSLDWNVMQCKLKLTSSVTARCSGLIRTQSFGLSPPQFEPLFETL